MTESRGIAVVGSGFAGSLLARILATLGRDVVLLERGTHPRFAIGESSTPLANLALERIGERYGFADCYRLATHGRWLEHHPDLRRGLKRGFTYYRHHRGEPFANRGLDSERLLVAASPEDRLADTHWLRADVDHHFVRVAIGAGVDYRDRVDLSGAELRDDRVTLSGTHAGEPFELDVDFVVDASGPGGFLARALAIPSALAEMETHSALVFGHFDDVALMTAAVAGLPDGPYPDDWAAVHHIVEEGWMYSLRFDHGVTSAGFLLTPGGLASLRASGASSARELWEAMLRRYPTIGALFADARPLFPIAFRERIQHRLTRAAGERWAMLPHAYSFVDPLFSTGISWALRGVERLAMAFEDAGPGRLPDGATLARYDALLAAEARQIDALVAGAYEAMREFDLFAAHAMLYFATVSFAEVTQRMTPRSDAAWSGFLGVGDALLEPLPREALRRLRAGARERAAFAEWIARAIAPRNIAGLADRGRHNLYPLDLEVLIERHALLGMTREQVLDALPALRGMRDEPEFGGRTPAGSSH
ncbi:MAG TPA: tryptophan 7-halogenase [Gemmatimonadaceae bacterium]